MHAGKQNIFNPQMVESADAECLEMEGRYIGHVEGLWRAKI